ncbi:InlB B-repeat-containing protein [Cohnella hongkongensis]|uniref:InlB B-repeat-containing protein n=1 Tax=Cohnella hongkongensis TaxID=178337 RepID=A0ABV9F9U6_9BACL
MRKIASVLLALMLLDFLPLGNSPAPASAAVEEFMWRTNDTGVTITGRNKKMVRNVVIPDTIHGKPVTEIGEGAFAGNPLIPGNQLLSVMIPDSVTKIAANAFRSNQLASVQLPSGIKSIGEGAFEHNLLTNVTIPDSLTEIGAAVFANNQLVGVTIPDSVTEIGASAFMNNQLDRVTIPDSVTEIGESAFAENQLVGVTIPDSVTEIGAAAFANNQLVDVTIAGGITEISATMFANNQLASVTIPPNIQTIGASAFANNQLTSLTIPGSVAEVHDGAFSSNHLSSIAIEGSTDQFGVDVFSGNLLQHITFEMSQDPMDDHLRKTFANQRRDGYSFLGWFKDENHTEQWMYDSVNANTTMYAKWEEAPFIWINSPSELNIFDDMVRITGYHHVNDKDVEIPDRIDGKFVLEIERGAFRHLGLHSVTLPPGHRMIDQYAFADNQLTNLTIPSGVVENLEIGFRAFANNPISSVTFININSVTFGEEVFFGNPLQQISFVAGATSIDNNLKETLANPSRDGYSFLGWFKEGDTEPWGYNSVDANTTLHARWEEAPFKVHFEGGAVLEAVYGQGVGTLPADPIRYGYVFKGWESGGAPFDAETPVYASMHVSARWEKAAFTVTFNNNDGDTEANPTTMEVLYHETVGTLPEPPPREGYTFAQWADHPTAYLSGQGAAFNADTLVRGDTTLYAIWTKNPEGEQFSLAPGGTYYFDLSSVKEDNIGAANPALPDISFKWIPFTYAGTVNAYSLSTFQSPEAATARDRSLFVADYNVTTSVSDGNLDHARLIYGKGYSAGGVNYMLRSLSVGYAYPQLITGFAGPRNNEWDQVMTRIGHLLGDLGGFSWGQDTVYPTASRIARGGEAHDGYYSSRGYLGGPPSAGFRPALEVWREDVDKLGFNGLKTVTYDMDDNGTLGTMGKGYKGDALTSATVVYTGTLTLPEITEENGFHIAGSVTGEWGWFDGTTLHEAGTTLELASGTVLKAQLIPEKYDITVEADGNGTAAASAASAPEGAEITLTAAPNAGYRFKEWLVVSGNIAITGDTFIMPDHPVTVRAVFEEAKYTLTVSDSYASPSGAGSYADGTTVTIHAGSRDHYTFSGWTTDDGVTLADANSPSTTLIMPAMDVTVYAQWTAEAFAVTFNKNGGDTDARPTVTTAVYGGNVGSLPTPPTRAGYTFAGWNTDAGGQGKPFSAATAVYADMIVYAQWTTVPIHSVTFNKNEGDTDAHPTVTTAVYGGNVGSLPTPPTRAGYTFAGWNTDAGGQGDPFDAATAVFADIIVYAQWTADPTYTVTYSGNGHTGGSAPSDPNRYVEGAVVTVQGNTGSLTRSGYTFAGWNSQADGKGASYAEGSTLTMGTDNVTLYAQWTANHGGGGVTPPPSSGGGGGSPLPVAEELFIDKNGTLLDPSEIDATKPSVTLEVLPNDAGAAYVRIPASVLTELGEKNAAFFMEIKTPYGSYQVPVELASLIPGLTDLLDANRLKAEDISFKITLTDKTGDEDIQAAFANDLPHGRIIGAIVDFRIEIVNVRTEQTIGTANRFSKALARAIPLPKDITDMPEQWGAFRHNEKTGKFEFVPALSVKLDDTWYAMIRSYTNSAYVIAQNPVSFADALPHWGEPSIRLAAAKGLVGGVGGGKYAPDRSVTRAEFTAMLVRALGRGDLTDRKASYDDVKPGAWYYEEVSQAKALGLLDFASGTRFNPDQPLTREEMASMIAAVIALEELPVPEENAALNGYRDIGSVGAAYLRDVGLMVKLNIMTGTSENTFSPKGVTTRAQAAVVFVRALEALGMIDGFDAD